MRTLVAVAPEPRPSTQEDFLAFMELIIPTMNDKEFMTMYWDFKARSWRTGQFFIRCLPPEYKRILTGSRADPWFKDDWESVYEALDYLLDHI